MAEKKGEKHRARRANVVRTQRAAALRPFYYALVIIAVIGIALIVRMARHSAATQQQQVTNVGVTAAQAKGHLLGNPNAPVQILEFADFECPHCAEFATITEPDVRKRIVDAGLASYRYFDFPLGHFPNSIAASEAAACAGDQNKFWEMHDKLFQRQPEWNSQATSNPKKVFEGYAKALGLDTDAWGKCYDSQKHMPDILANRAEGIRRHVESTPTFVIGTKQIPGAIPYDMFKAYVDSATAQFAARAVARADSPQPAGGGGSGEGRGHEAVKARMLIALLALVGVLVALYLTLYKVGVIGELVCHIGSCERVNTSRWAILFGLPVAAWGLATYVVLLALAFAAIRGLAPRSVALTIVALSGWGVLFSGWLTSIELFVIHAICIWCVTSATIMTLLFVTSVIELRRTLRAPSG